MTESENNRNTECLTLEELSFRQNQQRDFSAAYENQAPENQSVKCPTITRLRVAPANTARMDEVDKTRTWDVIGCPELVNWISRLL